MSYINYENSIVGIPNSILKHFNIKPLNKTNPILDDILNEHDYQNIIFMIFDGLGVYNINQHLTDDSFIKTHMVDQICSVFPPTTTSSTLSAMTGLMPKMHMHLGWTMNFDKLNDQIEIFTNESKNQKKYDYNVVNSFFKPKHITEIINENNYAKSISKFGDIYFDTLDDLKEKILQEAKTAEKKYLYVYHEFPDYRMHRTGVDSKEVHSDILEIDQFLADISKELENTLLIISADHGHVNSKNLFIDDYPELKNILKGKFFIESRSVGINLKPNCDEIFHQIFKSEFKDKFILLTKSEIVSGNYFGIGECHPDFLDYLPDYLMISNSEYSLMDKVEEFNMIKGNHAGITKNEGIIPLIIKKIK